MIRFKKLYLKNVRFRKNSYGDYIAKREFALLTTFKLTGVAAANSLAKRVINNPLFKAMEGTQTATSSLHSKALALYNEKGIQPIIEADIHIVAVKDKGTIIGMAKEYISGVKDHSLVKMKGPSNENVYSVATHTPPKLMHAGTNKLQNFDILDPNYDFKGNPLPQFQSRFIHVDLEKTFGANFVRLYTGGQEAEIFHRNSVNFLTRQMEILTHTAGPDGAVTHSFKPDGEGIAVYRDTISISVEINLLQRENLLQSLFIESAKSRLEIYNENTANIDNGFTTRWLKADIGKLNIHVDNLHDFSQEQLSSFSRVIRDLISDIYGSKKIGHVFLPENTSIEVKRELLEKTIKRYLTSEGLHNPEVNLELQADIINGEQFTGII